jgi:hypothetical protein
VILTPLFAGHTLGSGTVVQVKVLPPTGEWIGHSESYRIRGTTVKPSKGCLNTRGRKVRCPS